MKYTNKTAFCATQKSTQLSLLLSRKHSLTFIKHTLLLGLLVMGIFAQAQVTVSSNTVWNTLSLPPAGYEKGIVIKNNATLLIFNTQLDMASSSEILIEYGTLNLQNATLKMGHNSQIRLSSICGAHLELENTEISSITQHVWKGIRLDKTLCSDGQANGSPFFINSKAGANCTPEEWAGQIKGFVSSIRAESSTLKNARVAILIDGDTNPNNGGGYARIRNCKFINCQKGVSIYGLNNGDPFDASFIMSSRFEWNSDLQFPNDENLQHVVIDNTGKSLVRIGGCIFRNDVPLKLSRNQRGTGIHVTASSVDISKDGDRCCDGENNECPDNCFGTKPNQGNTFVGTGNGIVYDGVLPSNGCQFKCRYSDFSNCFYSIWVKNCSNSHIGKNTMTIRESDLLTRYPDNYNSNSGVRLLFCQNSSGLRIYDNTFDHDLHFISCITNKDPELTYTSFIRKNTFKYPNAVRATCGPKMRAIELYGNNNHLDITCNTFENHVYDIYVHDNATLNDLPNQEVHQAVYKSNKFSANNWSVLPKNYTDPDNNKWLTTGCSGNVAIDLNGGSMSIFDRYVGLGFDNIVFETYTINKQTNKVNNFNNEKEFFRSDKGRCKQENDPLEDCASCYVYCDSLLIHRVADVSGIEDLWQQHRFFAFYPNPAHDQINLRITPQAFSSRTYLSVVDLLGKEVFHTKIPTFETTVSLASLQLPDGKYVSKVDNGTYTSTAKLLWKNQL